MQAWQLDVVNEAVTQLMVGFGLALLNVVFCYFVRGAPRVIKVVPRSPQVRWLIFAYLIALVLQLVTSPLFLAAWQRVYSELAWSPYQALFNVLGVVLMDVIVLVYLGVRRGAEIGRQQISSVSERAAQTLGKIDRPVDGTSAEEPQPPAQSQAEHKQRLDDRLKDY